jgi:type IV secretory pathway component VirB8
MSHNQGSLYAPAGSNPSAQAYSSYTYDQEKSQKRPFRRRISKKCWWLIGIAGVIVLAAVIAIAVALGLRENNNEWKNNNP